MSRHVALQGWKKGKLNDRPDLLADLYESVLAPERVPEVLRAIDQALDCDGAHLIGAHPVTGAPLVSLMTSDGLKAGEQAYFQRYAALDPRLALGHAKPTGVGLACHDFFDHRYVARSEFYQDFLLPLGPRYIAGGNLLREPDRNLFLVFNHYRGRPQFQGAKRAAIAEWMPHLARWAGQLVRAERLRQAASFGERAVESLEQGLVFFDDAARVVHANAAAQRLLSDRLGPSVGLTPGRSGWAEGMRPLVLTVARQRQAMRFAMPAKGMTLTVAVLPLVRERGRRGAEAFQGLGALARPSSGGRWPHQASVVVTVDAAAPALLTLAQRATAWGLTPAERALLEAIVRGMTVVAYAAQAGIRESTARFHARGLMQKAGVSRLAELAGILR
jgi:DNA-binding CsgD family transcriptional regulator